MSCDASQLPSYDIYFHAQADIGFCTYLVVQMAGKGILHFDGASKGNPGKAGAGAVLMTEDGRVV